MNQTEILALAEKHGAIHISHDDKNDYRLNIGDVLFSQEEFTAFAAALMEAPAVALPAISADERKVIEMLLELAYESWNAADNSEERVENGVSEHVLSATWYEPLCAALDKLEELPDDQPGYTMELAAKARWALRRLLAAAPQPPDVQPSPAGADTPAAAVHDAARRLLDLANLAGQVVTIERKPLKPLAMGHAEYLVTVHPARKPS